MYSFANFYVTCETQNTMFDQSFPHTKKRVENMMHRGVFLKNFEVFGNAVKY